MYVQIQGLLNHNIKKLFNGTWQLALSFILNRKKMQEKNSQDDFEKEKKTGIFLTPSKHIVKLK